jgi:hypothetical protein
MSEHTTVPAVPTWDLADRMRKSLRHTDIGVQDMADYLGVGQIANDHLHRHGVPDTLHSLSGSLHESAESTRAAGPLATTALPSRLRSSRGGPTMHRIIAAAATAFLLAACGSPAQVVGTADPSSSSTGGAASQAAATAEAKAAKVGSAITLDGNNEGEHQSVTVVKVVQSPKSGNQFDAPKAGTRWVAVQLRIKNTGTVALELTPDFNSRVVDAEGQSYTSTLLGAATSAGPAFVGGAKLAPGKTSLGVVVFEVPKAAKVTGYQYDGSVLGGSTGEWAIG